MNIKREESQMTTEQTNKLLAPEDAAVVLGISPATLRDWLRAKKIKGVKVGKAWKIKSQDLDEYINNLPYAR
jgi:excisionase family DNA binding protein